MEYKNDIVYECAAWPMLNAPRYRKKLDISFAGGKSAIRFLMG